MSKTRIEEPTVISQMSAAKTSDNGLSRLNGLLTAAPLVTNYGPDYKVISSPIELLNTYLPDSSSKELTEDMHESWHNIYHMLMYSKVLVLRVGGDISGHSSKSHASSDKILSNIFGNEAHITYNGSIGITDKGKSVYLSTDNKVLDTYAYIKLSQISTQSSIYTKMLSDLSAIGAYVYGFKYTTDDELQLLLLYKFSDTSESSIKSAVNNSSIELPSAANLSVPNYEFIVVNNNLLGYTIDNNNISRLEYNIITVNNNGSTHTFALNINDETYNITVNTSSGITLEIDPSVNLTVIPSPTLNLTNAKAGVEKFTFTDTIRYIIDPDSSPTSINNVGGVKITEIINTVMSLINYDGGERIDFIFDSGICHNSLHAAMITTAEKTKSLALCSIDYEPYKSNFDGMLTAFNETSNERAFKLTPYVTYSISDYKKNLSPHINYISCIHYNKSTNSEFAPTFGIENGVVTNSNVTYMFNKEQREYLLGSHINTIKRDNFRGVSFILDNYTGVMTNSLFNEEQLLRMANRITWDCDYLLYQFLGRTDDEETARKVYDTLDLYMQKTIMTQRYRPAKYDIICNTKNNEYGDGILTVEMIIYVGRALKKIKLFVRELPLSSLTQEN